MVSGADGRFSEFILHTRFLYISHLFRHEKVGVLEDHQLILFNFSFVLFFKLTCGLDCDPKNYVI